MLMPHFLVWIVSIGLMILGAGVASGQAYPNKPVRIVCGPAGGGGDFVSRQIAPGLVDGLGQPVSVDNRTAFLAAEFVSKAPPDGYTLFVSGGSLWITPLLRKTPYDVAGDFSPISLLVREINALVVHPSLPVKSVKELIALSKARPAELNYSSAGIGTTNHLAMEFFKGLAGVNIVHVAYKGNAPAVTALIGGEVQMLISDVGFVAPHVKSGKLRALAVTSAEPTVLAPGLPTVSGSGLPGFEAIGMTGMLVPAKTPAAIINRLNQEVVRILSLPDVKQKFFNGGMEIVGSTPEQFAAAVKSEMVNFSKVIKDAGIKAD